MRRWLGILALLVIPHAAQAQVSIGPANISHIIYGQTINTPFTTELTVSTSPEGVAVRAVVTGDLSDLQRKFPAIVATIPLPNNNCPGYGTHVLPRIESASLDAQGTTAVIRATGSATAWLCARNPVPETVCRMVQRCLDLGPLGRPCTDVPTCHTRDGSPIKTIIVSEGFWGELPVSVVTRDAQSIEAVAGRARVEPRGDLSRFINDIARIFNADLSTLVDCLIQRIP